MPVTISEDITGVASVNSGAIGGRRNIVYNGEMKVAQRGASATGLGAAAGYFTLDRWYTYSANTAGRYTMAQVADGPPSFANCLKLTTTTADTSIAAGEIFLIETRFEGQDVQQLKKGTSTAEQVTVSFYVKGNAAALYVCELFDHDNGRSITQSFAVTTSWNRIELTFAADTSDPLDDDNGASLAVNFWLHVGSDFSSGTFAVNTWNDVVNTNRIAVDGFTSIFDSTSRTLFLTGVQMEIGATATDFESSTYGDELALCQRYYFRETAGAAYSAFAIGVVESATSSSGMMRGLPVPMRSLPTCSVSNCRLADGGAFPAVTSLGTNWSSQTTWGSAVSGSAGGMTVGRAVMLQANNNTAAYIEASAEL